MARQFFTLEREPTLETFFKISGALEIRASDIMRKIEIELEKEEKKNSGK